MRLIAALLSVPVSTLFVFTLTAGLFLYYTYAQCLYRAFRTGVPRYCYWMGIAGVAFVVLTAATILVSPESFSSIVIDSESDDYKNKPRVAAVGNLGQESFSAISGLQTPQRLGDPESE